jgi:hypothetical protein
VGEEIHSMAGEVDRVLKWMARVEQLEAQLEKTSPCEQRLIRAKLERAKQSQLATFEALIRAAHRGDPEAIVALEALESQIEEKTWVVPAA